AGKSTIATALERELFDRGKVAVRLDGENVRLGISRDLGFSATDRSENLRRSAEVARLLANQGVLTVAAFVAPDAGVRSRFRDLIGSERFFEVFIDTPIEVCRERDDRGLYAMADAGEITDFPGVSAPYDREETWDLQIDASRLSVAESVDAIVTALQSRGFLRG
ncbi:MAG: adenylyl-sulfate kinase, partial [Actinomycetota bacterium]